MAHTAQPFNLWQWLKLKGLAISILLSVGIGGIYLNSRPEFISAEEKRLKLGGLIELFDLLEAKTLDLRFRWRGERDPGDKIVIIGVDDKTEQDLGRWQSSGRQWIAQLLDILHTGGANVVGFDVVFSQPGEGAALTALDELQTQYIEHLPEGATADPEMLTAFTSAKREHDYDQQLAEAINRYQNVILGIYFQSKRGSVYWTPDDHTRIHAIIDRIQYKLIRFPAGENRRPLSVATYAGAESNLPIFSDAARSFGFFNAWPYSDGYLRQAMLILKYQDIYYPSLAIQMTRAYLNLVNPPIIQAFEREGGVGAIGEIQIGDIHIPTDETGKLLINYYGSGGTFKHYSLSDVLLGQAPPETFRDKIVLVGFTSPIYQDLHPTSFQKKYPGVETHATVIANILRQEFLIRPEATILTDLLVIAGCGLLLGILLPRTRPITGAIAVLLCLGGVIGGTYYAFTVQRTWLNMIYPALFVILDYVVLTSHKYFTEEKKKREVKLAFQHYVAPTIVEQMLGRMDQLKLGGERKVLTAMFSDIRGFTSISEQMTPEELVKFLNEYLSAMTQIVLQYEGTVDKYMGDAIMAFFGAPIEQPDHAIRACRTAVDMIARLKELRAGWATRGLPLMNIGIGINSGDMSVGNMGSEERFDYTIMGDHVNLASRLEGINKQYGTNIVISEFTRKLIHDEPFIVRELDAVRVKGKHEPVVIYELVGYGMGEADTDRLLKLFSMGLDAYQHGQWAQALAAFQEALRIRPDDEPAKLYCERCAEYQQQPPPPDWDGVFIMNTK